MPSREGLKRTALGQGEVIGKVLRTQTGVNPVYVSLGHRISLATACEWILKAAPKYRLPETTRQVDRTVRAALKKAAGNIALMFLLVKNITVGIAFFDFINDSFINVFVPD